MVALLVLKGVVAFTTEGSIGDPGAPVLPGTSPLVTVSSIVPLACGLDFSRRL